MTHQVPGRRVILIAMGVVAVVGLNLRMTLAVVSPLVPEIQADYRLDSAQAGLAMTAAVAMFGVLAPLAPWLMSRYRPHPVLLLGLALVVAGTAWRSIAGPIPFYLGMVVLGGGIALMNVVMPVIVKQDFPNAVGLCTGLYTSALNVGSAVAAATAVPVAHAIGGWRPTAALAAIPALVAMALWWAHMRRRRGGTHGAISRTRLLGSPLAWQVTAYMALQSVLYYVLLAWLPTAYADSGFSAAQGGMILAVAQLAQIFGCLLVPVLARTIRDQRMPAVGAAAVTALAYLGITVAPAGLPVLWAILLGLGQGAALTVSLMLIVLRSPDPATSARLSGMAQGIGYLLAAAGPPLVGVLRDITGGWTVALALMTSLCVVELVVGGFAGRDRLISPAPPAIATLGVRP